MVGVRREEFGKYRDTEIDRQRDKQQAKHTLRVTSYREIDRQRDTQQANHTLRVTSYRVCLCVCAYA